MPKTVNKLTDLKIRKLSDAGLYSDGGGLYLQVTRNAAKSWIFKFSLRGRSREMGLGSLSTVSLAEARELARAAKRTCSEGKDPIEERQRARQHEEVAAVGFMDCAHKYIASHSAAWRNKKHAAQWLSTLETYVAPYVAGVPVQKIDVETVLKILEKIWSSKPETARRVRGRIENVLDWAKVRGYREGENPARWRGHLEMLLPAVSKSRAVKHHSALPFKDIPRFMKELRTRDGAASKALEFLILTAARTGEVLGAKTSEIFLGERMWVVPAHRMKAGKEHRVPLSETAAKLAALQIGQGDGYVFRSGNSSDALSNMALLAVLKRMGHGNITVHGFRSTFRDWAAECTNYPREVVEMALAHTIENRVEAAYRRGDLYEKRVQLMREWEAYCGTANSNVVLFVGA